MIQISDRKKRKTHQASKKKKEELPSFLSNLTGVPEEIELPTKPTKSVGLVTL